MRSFELALSLRYLFGKERRALVAVISIIAVLGVAIGVAALVVVLGVMDGAQRELFGKVISLYPHAKILRSDGEEIDDPASILRAAADGSVLAAAPVFEREALFSSGLGSVAELVAARVVASEAAMAGTIFPVLRTPDGGRAELGEQEILLGEPLAEKLRVKKGDAVLVISGLTAKSANRRSPSRALRVAGIFRTGYFMFDQTTSFVTPSTAQSLGAAPGSAGYIDVKLKDPAEAGAYRERLREKLGPLLRVETWEDEQGMFFQSIQLQKAGLYLILMLIIMVAGFNIVGTLILMVIEKTRSIGVMRSFGASEAMIRRIFAYVGTFIGLAGTAAGMSIGVGICLLLKHAVRFEMPPSVYNFDRLPVTIHVPTLLFVAASAMFVCVMAALLPSIQASRLDPVEALRHE